MTRTTTWMKELTSTREAWNDAEGPVTLAPDLVTFLIEFDPTFGGLEGLPVLAWTEARVYFPVAYDGAEWMESAPRNPQSEGQGHAAS